MIMQEMYKYTEKIQKLAEVFSPKCMDRILKGNNLYITKVGKQAEIWYIEPIQAKKMWLFRSRYRI